MEEVSDTAAAAAAYDEIGKAEMPALKPYGAVCPPCPPPGGTLQNLPSHALPTEVCDRESEGLAPPTLHTMSDAPPRRPMNWGIKRREVEARRYTGKENVEEYLLQFELTSRRNAWDDFEKASALLCALDGTARGILSEFDDPTTATYAEVKDALVRRFGSTKLIEVHEQTLSHIRLQKGQSIRELSQEVQRLVKKVYPDVLGPPRERLAVKHLINAIPEKDAVFYVREKNPQDVAQACSLYERFTALANEDHQRRSGVRGVGDSRPDKQAPSHADPPDLQRQVTEAINRMTAATTQQIQRLTDALDQIRPAAPAPPTPINPAAQPHAAPVTRPPPVTQPPTTTTVPVKPCPRCKQPGHWARDCPHTSPQQSNAFQYKPPTGCFRCGQLGHTYAQCRSPPLNFPGPMPAPSVGPRHPRQN